MVLLLADTAARVLDEAQKVVFGGIITVRYSLAMPWGWEPCAVFGGINTGRYSKMKHTRRKGCIWWYYCWQIQLQNEVHQGNIVVFGSVFSIRYSPHRHFAKWKKLCWWCYYWKIQPKTLRKKIIVFSSIASDRYSIETRK